MEMIRAFIAADLEKNAKGEISKVVDKFKKTCADVKYVEEKNLHFTLKFLSSIPIDKISNIKESLRKVTRERESFEILLKGGGVFPNINYIKVLWIGVDKGREELISLSKEIEEALSKLGFPKESRPFSPHLTIGRVRSPRKKEQVIELVKQYTGKEITESRISSVKLMKSTLTPKGPIYETIGEYALKRS